MSDLGRFELADGRADASPGEPASARLRSLLPERLTGIFDGAKVLSLAPLTGGASKESWAVDVSFEGQVLELVLRMATGGAVYSDMLSLRDEYAMLRVAFGAGVRAPRPRGFLEDLDGRDAFLMERVRGETIGKRVVHRPELRAARGALPDNMADELAAIHAIVPDSVRFLPGPRKVPACSAYLDALSGELDRLLESYPAIELGLHWLRENPPESPYLVVVHGDFRIGNLAVDRQGLTAVLDWETAHLGDPLEDLGWCLVRAWRFGADDRRLGGIADIGPFVDRYRRLSGREVPEDRLLAWELAGNVRWAIGSVAQGLRHITGEERGVELAILSRLAAEVEFEILRLLELVG